MVVLLDDGLEFFGVEDDSFFTFVGVGNVDNPHKILMVLFDGFADSLDDLTLAKQLVGCAHILQIDVEHSARSACNLELAESLIPLEVNFDVLRQIHLDFPALVVDVAIVEEDGLIGQESVVFVLQMGD